MSREFKPHVRLEPKRLQNRWLVKGFAEVARYTFTPAVRGVWTSTYWLVKVLLPWTTPSQLGAPMVFLSQTSSLPQWLKAEVCEDHLQDAPKVATNKQTQFK